MKQNNLSVGDFPDLNRFKRDLEHLNFEELPKIKGSRMKNGKRMQDMEELLNVRIPAMLNRLPGLNKV